MHKDKYLKYKKKYLDAKYSNVGNYHGGGDTYIQCGTSNKYFLVYTENKSVYAIGKIGSLNYNVFTEILSNVDVKFMVGGKDYAFIYTNDGKLYGIGSNNKGQLGLGENVTEVKDVLLIKTDEHIKNIFCYFGCTLILKTDNKLYMHGMNFFSQFFSNVKKNIIDTDININFDNNDIAKLTKEQYIYKETYILKCVGAKQVGIYYSRGHFSYAMKWSFPFILKYNGSVVVLSADENILKNMKKYSNEGNGVDQICAIYGALFILYRNGGIVNYKEIGNLLYPISIYKNTDIKQIFATDKGRHSHSREERNDAIGLSNKGGVYDIKLYDDDDEGESEVEFNEIERYIPIVSNQENAREGLAMDNKIYLVSAMTGGKYFCLKDDGTLMSIPRVKAPIFTKHQVGDNLNVLKMLNVVKL